MNLGIGAADINKLKAAGYYTIAVCLLNSLGRLQGFISYSQTEFTNGHLCEHGSMVSAANVCYLRELSKSCLSATRKNLAKIKGFSEQKVEKVKEAAGKCAVCIS